MFRCLAFVGSFVRLFVFISLAYSCHYRFPLFPLSLPFRSSTNFYHLFFLFLISFLPSILFIYSFISSSFRFYLFSFSFFFCYFSYSLVLFALFSISASLPLFPSSSSSFLASLPFFIFCLFSYYIFFMLLPHVRPSYPSLLPSFTFLLSSPSLLPFLYFTSISFLFPFSIPSFLVCALSLPSYFSSFVNFHHLVSFLLIFLPFFLFSFPYLFLSFLLVCSHIS